ncbi:transcription termination factor Rho [Pseudonocardia acidicola]|nr:transcription termination factor Rho [Pseudonocardia acidicola]
MVLAELRQLAGELNIPDTTGMRKGDLIAAIKERQAGGAAAASGASTTSSSRRAASTQLPLPENGDGTAAAPVTSADAPASGSDNGAAPAAATTTTTTRRRRTASRPAGAPDPQPAAKDAGTEAAASPAAESAPATAPAADRASSSAPAATPDATAGNATESAAPATGEAETGTRRTRQTRRGRGADRNAEQATDQGGAATETGAAAVPAETAGKGETDTDGNDRGSRQDGRRSRQDGDREGRGDRDGGRNNRGENRGDNNRNDRGDRNDNRGGNDRNDRNTRDSRDDDSDDEGDGRGRRGRRFRDRRRGRDRDRDRTGGGGGQNNVDTEVRDDDVLLPVAGIVDILDNYAFVRTTGYLSGPTDVYVSLSMVRKYGLRRGDAITGAVRQPREGEQARQKFNPLVRVDTVNGRDPEFAKQRPEFTKLTPLYPNERLRLETEPSKLTTRVIDLVMPIGKGQRALIVSPPKAGKTMIMQSIANAITTNNPECHLMVVLVDERPEEVTDMQRSVKGEVIASTFDRPPSDHTTVAELAIERAKRLVEMGHDVVVLLDSITRLGRAYNLAAPASGRILSGGVDSTALYPPKRFLGAARNIEDGGSLTIFATALVETGSTMDTVIFEEFKGTGNAELKLDRKIADKRVFPAIDIDASGTRKEELLLSPDELAVTVKLRRVLAALDDQQAIDLILDRLRKTRTNIEFLMSVAKTTPGSDDN